MKIATVLGTRPEIIKMAPIINEIEKRDINQILIQSALCLCHITRAQDTPQQKGLSKYENKIT